MRERCLSCRPAAVPFSAARSSPRSAGVSFLIGLLLLAAAEAGPTDPRSQVLLDLECSSHLGRTRTTLFGNGTVRYREWVDGEERMLLLELDPERLSGYVNRLTEVELEETESMRYGAAGEWVEECEVRLDLPPAPPRRFRFNRYDSLPLSLSRIVAIAGELQEATEAEATEARFPRGYEPRAGDVLERRDGLLFEVVGYTSDDRGIELRGVEQPLVMYVLVDEVVGEFVALVDEGGRR